MKIVVTHASPDLDAVASVWIVKKFLPGWENAIVKYIPAGDRINLEYRKISPSDYIEPIETIGKDEVIHVDTGLGPLDHHQNSSDKVCAASLVLDFVKTQSKIKEEKLEALKRMVKVIVDIDHFKESLRPDSLSDYHEFELYGIIEGIKYQFPGQDDLLMDFIIKCLDAILHNFENRIWAEKEIEENGIEFAIREGKALAIETMNDTVIKLAQKMNYSLVARKDPKSGYIRIKASPKTQIDLTPVYGQLKQVDPNATWFLHVGKKMLLNGTTKNPKMKPSKLTLSFIVDIVKKIYG